MKLISTSLDLKRTSFHEPENMLLNLYLLDDNVKIIYGEIILII